MVPREKTTGGKPSSKFNLEGLKLVGATILACFALGYPFVKWMKTPGSNLLETETGQSPSPSVSIPYPQSDVHAMMLRGDVNALKKLIDGADDYRTEWCLCMLESALIAKGEVSLDFALDGLEERIGPNGSPHWIRFDGVLRRFSYMPPQVQADILLHVKSFSSDPKKIEDVQFWHRSILEHKALRDAVIKVYANKMPEEFMRKLVGQCQSPAIGKCSASYSRIRTSGLGQQ